MSITCFLLFVLQYKWFSLGKEELTNAWYFIAGFVPLLL